MVNDIKTAVSENRAKVGAFAGAFVILVASVIGGVALQPGQQVYLETFDGAPTAPQPFVDGTNGWHVSATLDTRQNGQYAQQAHHGPACQPPLTGIGPSAGAYTATNSHQLVTSADTVFQCSNHLMTATGLAGFGDVVLSPPALLDFSGGPARFEWDMSTFRTGSRDWVNFTLMPESQYIKGVVPTDEGNHNPADAIHVFMGGVFGGTDVFVACQRVNNTNTTGSLGGCFPDRYVGGNTYDTWDMVQDANGVLPSASRRDHFVIELSATHIKVCITGNNTGQTYTYHGASGFCWSDTNLPTTLGSVWQGHAALVIDHASYNVEKSCSDGVDQFNIIHNATGDANCPPDTWHFDNISMAPAVGRGGAPLPTPSPTSSATPTPVPTITSSPSPSTTPVATPTAPASPSSPSPTSTTAPTATASPSPSPSPTVLCEAMVRLNGQIGWAPQPPSFCGGFH